jgi:hypothetical protein
MNFEVNLSQYIYENKSTSCNGAKNKIFQYLNPFKAPSKELNADA